MLRIRTKNFAVPKPAEKKVAPVVVPLPPAPTHQEILDTELRLEMAGMHDIVLELNNPRIPVYCDRIKRAIEKGANVNLTTKSNFTPSHLAAFVGNSAMLKFIIEKGADIDALDHEGNTILHIAAIVGKPSTVAIALEAMRADESKAEARINKRNIHGDTALHQVANAHRNPNIAKLLLNEKADYNLQNNEGQSSLDLARLYNLQTYEVISRHNNDLNKDRVQLALRRVGTFITFRKFVTSFIYEEEDEVWDDLVKSSMEEVVNMAKADKEIANQLLLPSLRIVYNTLFIATKAEVSLEDRDRYFRNMEEVMGMIKRLVVEAGADPNIKTEQDFTALHFASYLKLVDIAKVLIAKGADVNARDEFGSRPATYGMFTMMGNISALEFMAEVFPVVVESAVNKTAKSTVQESVTEISKEKTPQERLEELQKLMVELQRMAVRPGKISDEGFKVALMANQCEPGIVTGQNWNGLHLAVVFGERNDITKLLAKNIDVNAKTNDGKSVLTLALNRNKETADLVLSWENLEFSVIAQELKNAITSSNKKNVSWILGNENVLKKFSVRDDKRKLLEEWRTLVNQHVKAANKSEIKDAISLFGAAANLVTKQKEEVQKDAPLSKKEREKIRKEENRKKDEEEAKRKKILEEKRRIEAQARAEEIVKMSAEDVNVASQENPESESKDEEEGFEEEQDVEVQEIEEETDHLSEESVTTETLSDFTSSKSSATTDSEDLSVSPHLSPTSRLSVFAAEFIPAPKLPASASQLSPLVPEFIPASELPKMHREQMDDFLAGPRQIKSLNDLPQFMQGRFGDLLAAGHRILLKGSAVYQKKSARIPADLDVEILVRNMRKWSDKKIADFIRNNFELEIDSKKIYRGPNDDGSVFSVNVKDEKRKIDFSFYDRHLQPPDFLAWTTSKETKILFEGNAVKRVQPKGFSTHLRENGLSFNARSDFIINKEARGLMMRLCFLQTIGHINENEIMQSLPTIYPRNPVDLLFKELKLDLPEAAPNMVETTKKKIGEYINAHELNAKLRADFLQNLGKMMDSCHPDIPNPRGLPQYQELYKALDKMVQETKTPSSVFTSNSPVTVLAAQQTVQTK